MKTILNKIILWPGYYALIITLIGILASTVSWSAEAYIPRYIDFLMTLDLSWIGALASLSMLIPLASISAFDHFTGRRNVKIKRFINNEFMLWQLLCFIFTVLFVSMLLNIFEHYISVHIIVGINLTYTAFVSLFIVKYFNMLLTNK